MLNRKISDLPVVPEARYVYESPDGGLTVYKREVGTNKKVRVRQDSIIIKRNQYALRAQRLLDILKVVEDDPTLNDALQQLEALYILKYGDAKNN